MKYSVNIGLLLSVMVAALGTTVPASGQNSRFWATDMGFAPAIEGKTLTGVGAYAYPGGQVLINPFYGIINGKVLFDLAPRRMNGDGSLDSTFNAPVGTSIMAVLPDGRVLVGSHPQSGTSAYLIRRLLTDGSIDPGFSPVQTNYDLVGTELLNDGRVLIYGQFTTVNGVGQSGMVLLAADGTVDGSFNSPFPANTHNEVISSAKATADGQHIIIAGGVLNLGTGLGAIARLNLDGSLDPGFNAATAGLSGNPLGQVYPDPDGGLFVVDSGHLVRLLSTGARDTGFVPALVGSNWIFGARQTDGKIFYQAFGYIGGTESLELRRMNPDGSDDAGFAVIAVPYGSYYTVGLPVLMDDGTFFVGPVNAQRAAARLQLTHVLTDGTIDSGFNPRFSTFGSVDAIVRQSDGRLLIAGAWDYVNNAALSAPYSLLRLNYDGTTDSSFACTIPAGAYITRLVLQPGGKILAIGYFPNGTGGFDAVRRFAADGSADASFQAIPPYFSGLSVDGSGRIYIYGIGGGVTPSSRRYSPDGILDGTFQAGSSNLGLITAQADGSLLAVVAGPISGEYSVVRLLDDGSQDPAFTPVPGYAPLIAMVPLPDGGAVFCEQNSLGGSSYYFSLRRMRPDGTIDYNYTTGSSFGTIASLDNQLAIAGVLYDFLHAASPSAVTSVAVNFANSVVQTTMDCRSDGELVMHPTSSGTAPILRYLRTALAAPSYDVAPVIVETDASPALLQPLGATLFADVIAGGLEPLTYQWLKDGTPIPGQTSETLDLTIVDATSAGNYTVTVSNDQGSVTSNSFPVTVDLVHAAAAILTQPSSGSVGAGGSITFSVAASGNPAPTYQWLFNGNSIAGATGSSLTLTNVQPANAGSYNVLVRNTVQNAAGTFSFSKFSHQASLTLAQTISFTGPVDQPFSTTPITLAATASSGLPVSFSVVSGPASVNGNGLTLTGVGPVTVRASQGGNATYATAADVDQSFLVTANFGSWAQGRFTSDELLNHPELSGPNAVYGQDGLPNLIKYALGLEPKQNITTGLPTVSNDGTNWIYTYTRPDGTVITDVTYAVEYSTDLVNWTSAGVIHEMVSSSGGIETWHGRYPQASAPNCYFRLVVTQ